MNLFNFTRMPRMSSGLLALAVAGLGAATSARADIVFDSLSGANAHATYDASGAFVRYMNAYQCFAACTDPTNTSIVSEPILSLGDSIALTPNSGRALTGLDVGVVQAVGSAALTFRLTLSIYTPALTLVAQQQSSAVTLAAVPTSYGQTYSTGTLASIVPFAFGPFNLPDQFIYTLAFTSTTAAPTGFGLWLWDYYQDGTPGSIPVGTDIGNTGSVANNSLVTKVYGTTASSSLPTTALGPNNFAGLSDGYTPAVRFNVATPTAVVPEPSSIALMLAGLGVMGVLAARRKS